MADSAPSPRHRPIKADPEVISAPPPSSDASAEQALAPAEQNALSADELAQSPDNATFDSTKKHVANRQKTSDSVERFANTKHNIALINDPENGPRFTLTKKESGLVDESDDKDIAPETAKEAVSYDPSSSALDDTRIERKAEPETDETPQGTEKKDEPSPDAPKTSDEPTTELNPPAAPLGVPPAAEPPDKTPIDSAKTFVGPNGTYYDESWRWMDWCGTRQSWNWPAALSFGHWFAYRRLYGHAAIYLTWLVTLAAGLVNNIPAALVAGLFLLTPVLTGLYANTLYFLSFRRAVSRITEKGEGSYDELLNQLAKAGGISPMAPWFMAGFMLLGMGFAFIATYVNNDGFQVNLWPF